MATVQIDRFIAVSAPFDRDFHNDLRQIQGHWFDYAIGCWRLPGEFEDRVRQLALRHFGTDGATVADRVDLHIELHAGVQIETSDKSIDLDGLQIVRLSNYRAVPGQLISLSGVDTYPFKVAPGKWQLCLKVKDQTSGKITIKGIGKMRASRAIDRFSADQLEERWMEAIQSIWMEGSDQVE